MDRTTIGTWSISYQLFFEKPSTGRARRSSSDRDLGVILLDLFAYVGDQLNYYQDAIAGEGYLGTEHKGVIRRRRRRKQLSANFA